MGGRDQSDQAGDGESPADQPTVTFSPTAEFPRSSAREREALRAIGQQWSAALDGHEPRQADLPLDPALGNYRTAPAPTRLGRFARIQMFRAETPEELVATEPAVRPGSRFGQALTRLQRVLLGPPLASAAVVQERMRKVIALPVLSSDLLSSVAYGPEAMIAILVLAGSGALGLALPLGVALVVLMIAVGVSYRQTVRAYPHGAGSYIVASDNLGSRAGLAAAAGLMMDYILTVSVSVASGIAAITSALPVLAPLRIELGIGAILLLLAGNLRGVRTAGNIFAAPTYAFILAIGLLLAVGLAQAGQRGFTPVPPPPLPATEALSIVVVLRAFASGATSMTGIEAVSNAVPVFRPPEWRNARTTLTIMIALLVTLFAGLVGLIHLTGVVPAPGVTVLSELARRTFPHGPWFWCIQVATALVLLLAANTAFNDFPRLLYFMARDCYAPRLFLRLGDRLALNNGIIALAVPAGLIFVAFRGQTQALIPLYAVGVFLAFTLSQAGMVVRWARRRGAHWHKSLAINAIGAVLSAAVLVTAALTKFMAGAWVVVLAVPLIILLATRIRRHYDQVRRTLSLEPLPQRPPAGVVPTPPHRPAEPDRTPASDGQRPEADSQESAENPNEILHLVVVPVARLDLPALHAMAYATSLGQPAFAVHISPDEEEGDRFREEWQDWGDHLRLEVIDSPYRAIIPPLAHYLQALHAMRPDTTLTVILPEIVVKRWWHRPLHSPTPQRLRRALRALPGIVVTSVPIHVPE